MTHVEDDLGTPSLTGKDGRASIPFQSLKNEQIRLQDRPVEGGDDEHSSLRFRRRRTLVNSEHQLRFTSVLLVQMTAVMLAIGSFAYWESQRSMELILGHLADSPLRSHELHVANQAFLFRILAVIAVAAFAQILFGIYASHKVAGPVVKMTRVMEAASRGDFSARVTFRAGDDLAALASELNRLLASLAAEQDRARADLAEAEAALAHVVRSGGGADEVAALRETLARIAGIESSLPVACGR